MQATPSPTGTETSRKRAVSRGGSLRLPVLALLSGGLLVRLFNAGYRYLNPDEALHYLLSVQDSAAAAYRASLTTVHPPLLIMWLYVWRGIGHSEILLRLPCVIAGTLFCWVVFCWLRRTANESVALTALALLLFSPPLIQLSAEVRQYAFLLLFCALSLYFLDRALDTGSTGMALLSALALWLALLTHYSSLIFALTIGLYAIARGVANRPRPAVAVIWLVGQILALALVAFLYVHHISKIEASGQAASIADTYLSRSVLHPGQNPLWFIARSNLRVFHYFFSQGAVGVVGLLLFFAAVLLLVRQYKTHAELKVSPRHLALLLLLPLVVNCAFGLLRVYPYGGTRHDAYLAIFVFPAIAVALSAWKPPRYWWKPVLVATLLIICNLFPAPVDQYIRLPDQSRGLMRKATVALDLTPANSIIFTDDQGGLLLSYYLCNAKVIQIEQSPFQSFFRVPCGAHTVISIDPDWWIFKAETFPETMAQLKQTYNFAPGTQLTLFQAGWFIDKEAELREELKQYGCSSPQYFGKNMFQCAIRVPGR